VPKQQIKDYSGGINTRLNKHRIAENEAQNAVDVDLSGAKLKPTKTTDTTNPPSGDKKFKGSWVTDADATKFEEYGDVLIKSYDTKDPEFSTASDSTSKTLGVASKPSQAVTASVESSGSTPTTDALAYHTVETDSLSNTASLPNALITELLSNSTSYADTRTDKKDTLSPVFKAGDYYYFFTKTSGSAKVEKWSDSAKIAEVVVTHTGGNSTIWNRNDTHLVSLNSANTHASVVTLNSGNGNAPTATDVSLQTMHSSFETLNSDTSITKFTNKGQTSSSNAPSYRNPGYTSLTAGTTSIGISDSKAQISRSYSGEYVSGLRARDVSASESNWNKTRVKQIKHTTNDDSISWELKNSPDTYYLIGGWVPITNVTFDLTTDIPNVGGFTNQPINANISWSTNNLRRVKTDENIGWYLSTVSGTGGTDGAMFSTSLGGTSYLSQVCHWPYAIAWKNSGTWSRNYKIGGNTVTKDSCFAVWIYKTTTSNTVYLKWRGDFAFCMEMGPPTSTDFKIYPYEHVGANASSMYSAITGNWSWSDLSGDHLQFFYPMNNTMFQQWDYVRGYGMSGSWLPGTHTAKDYTSNQHFTITRTINSGTPQSSQVAQNPMGTGQTIGHLPALDTTSRSLSSVQAGNHPWAESVVGYSDGNQADITASTNSSGDWLAGNNNGISSYWGHGIIINILKPSHTRTYRAHSFVGTGNMQSGANPSYITFQNAEGAYGGQTGGNPTALGNTIRLSYDHRWSVLDILVGYSTHTFAGNVGLKFYTTTGFYYPHHDTATSLWRTYFSNWQFIHITNSNNEGIDLSITDSGEVYINDDSVMSGFPKGTGTYATQFYEQQKHKLSYVDQITLSNASVNSLVYPETVRTTSGLGYTRSNPDENIEHDKVHGFTTNYITSKRNRLGTTDQRVDESYVYTTADSASSVSTLQGGTENVAWGSTERTYVGPNVLPYNGTNLTSYPLTGTTSQGSTSVASFKNAEIKNNHLILSGSADGYAIIPFANISAKIIASDHTGVSVYAGTSSVQDVATAFFDSGNNLTHTLYASTATTAKIYKVSGSEISLFNIPTTSGILGLDIDTSNNYVLAFVNSTASALSTYKKFNYVFSSGLPTKTIRDSTTNSLSGIIYKVLTDAGNANRKYVLVDVSTYHLFNTSGLEINVYGSTWLPITAIGKTNTLTLSAGMSGTASIGTSVGLTQSLLRQIQAGDVVTGGSNTTTVSGKTAGTTSLTLANTQTNNSGVTLTFTRFVQKNTAWIISSDINNVKVAGSLPNYSPLYTNPESIAFASLTNIEHQPLNKSTSALDGTTTYYLVVFDKNITSVDSEAQNGISLDLEAYVVGASNMFNADGPNLGFQYKYSQLRNIGTTSEPVLIEGPVSDASESVSIATSQDFIRLSNFQGGPASDITAYRVYRVGGDYASYGWLADVDVSSSVPSNYDDSARIITSTTLTPLQNANPVPTASGKHLKHITNVSGIFFGAFDAQLRFSEFGNPHSWPATGFTDLDGTITGIVEYQGEGIVFTPNATYRVRGNNFDSMSAVKLPQQQGVPASNVNSIINVNNTIFFISNDGLCAYAGGRINVISQGKLNPFPTITNVKGASKDNVLYFFGSSGQGVACDLRRESPIFSRISETTDQRAFYVQEEDRLYLKKSSNGGAFQESATDNSITFQSRTYDFADANEYKVYKRAQVTYKGSGSITFKFDETTNETFSLSNSTNELAKYLEFSVARTAKQVEYTVTGQIEIIEMAFDADALTTYDTEVRFENIDVTYKGDPTIEVQIDGSVVTMTPTLISSNNVRTMRLYFPSATQGYLPHYRNSGITGDIMSVKYNTSEL